MRPDRERRIKELILAATPERVEALSRQSVPRPEFVIPEIVPGHDPWDDYSRYTDAGYRLYCYQSIRPLDIFNLKEIARGKLANLAIWYDLQHQEASIIVQVKPDKLLKIPAETSHLAAFWVATSNPPN